MEIRVARSDELPLVLAMSDRMVDEGCCNGMVRDTLEYLSQYTIYMAVTDGVPLGYAYATVNTAEQSRHIVQAGEKLLYLEEIYIVPEARGRGIGQALYRVMEQKARELGCACVTVTAVSKQYQALLHFYVEELGFLFWSAQLVKRLD